MLKSSPLLGLARLAQDSHIAARWADALQHHAAAVAATAAAAVAAAGVAVAPPQSDAKLRAAVVGGLGLQALLLHALLSCYSRGTGTDATAGAAGDATAGAGAGGVEVTWLQGDDLSSTLAAMMAASASVPAAELTVTTAWPEPAAAVPVAGAAAGSGEAAGDGSGAGGPAQQEGGGGGGLLQLVVAPGLCTARLALREWAAALAQVGVCKDWGGGGCVDVCLVVCVPRCVCLCVCQ